MTTKQILIDLVIVALITLGVWFLVKTPPVPDVITNFSEDGNVTHNNPGQKPDVWYLVYEKPGTPGASVELLFDKIQEPILSQGERVHVEGVLTGNVVSVVNLIPKQRIKLYYYNPALDQGPGGPQCSRNGLVAIERDIPKTQTPLKDTIELLLQGALTEIERAQGITTEFPLSGVSLKSASITNGIATLTFNDPENKTGGGSCRVSILWAQIEATAKQFPSITSVRFMPEELFQP